MSSSKQRSGAFTLKSTKIGKINVKIEESISGVFRGDSGSTGQALGLAKQREMLLRSGASRKKETA